MEDQIRIQQAGINGVLSVVEALETNENFYIVQDFYEGGDLEMKKRNVDKISEKDCAYIIF